MSENLLHRCALCGAVVAPESARLVPTCGGHLESDADRWNTPLRIRGARPEDDEVLRRIARDGLGFFKGADLPHRVHIMDIPLAVQPEA